MTAARPEDPYDIGILCERSEQLSWVQARTKHWCMACDTVTQPGEVYLRARIGTGWGDAWDYCPDCAWATYGPEGQEASPSEHHEHGRGCLVDVESAEWVEYQRQRMAEMRAAVEGIFKGARG